MANTKLQTALQQILSEEFGGVQAKMAEATGYSPSDVNRWLSVSKPITLEGLHSLATAASKGDETAYGYWLVRLTRAHIEAWGADRRKRKERSRARKKKVA